MTTVSEEISLTLSVAVDSTPRRFTPALERTLIIVPSQHERMWRTRELMGRDDVLYVKPDDPLHGMRFSTIINTVTRHTCLRTTLERDRFHRWFEEQVRCRLAVDGVLIDP